MNFDGDLLIAILVVGLSLSIPIVAIIVDHFTKKSKMRLMEKALEKGVSIENLSMEDAKKPRVPYRSGMVLLATGIGLCIFAVFTNKGMFNALMPLLGAGSIAILIGVALIINDKINYERLFNKKAGEE